MDNSSYYIQGAYVRDTNEKKKANCAMLKYHNIVKSPVVRHFFGNEKKKTQRKKKPFFLHQTLNIPHW